MFGINKDCVMIGECTSAIRLSEKLRIQHQIQYSTNNGVKKSNKPSYRGVNLSGTDQTLTVVAV